jgi:CheY-like chemotaxis protein
MATDTCPATVLVIEDDERWREMMGTFLEARGYPTALAESTQDGLDALAMLERPCLVLVDVLGLGVDYGAILAALGPHDRMATLPMVLVSVKAPELFSRPAGIKRPVNLDILFRIVEDHCCRGHGGGGTVRGGHEALPTGG